MNFKDAARKVRLLSRVTPRNGATAAEAETAAKLARGLMERFAVHAEDVRPTPAGSSQLSWVYWVALLGEFGVALTHFGMRGSAQWGNGFQLFIRLDSGLWSVKKQSSDGLTLIASDFGIETFRGFMRLNGPRILHGGGVSPLSWRCLR